MNTLAFKLCVFNGVLSIIMLVFRQESASTLAIMGTVFLAAHLVIVEVRKNK